MMGTGILLILVFGFFLSSLIIAVILRAACSLWNKWFGKRASPVVPDYPSEPVEASFPDESNPFSARDLEISDHLQPVDGVMQPGFGHAFVTAMMVVFINFALRIVASLLFATVIGGVAGGGMGRAEFAVGMILQVGSFPILFMIYSFVIKARLGTTFPRAMAVTGIAALICVAVAVVLGVVGAVIGLLVGVLL